MTKEIYLILYNLLNYVPYHTNPAARFSKKSYDKLRKNLG